MVRQSKSMSLTSEHFKSFEETLMPPTILAEPEICLDDIDFRIGDPVLIASDVVRAAQTVIIASVNGPGCYPTNNASCATVCPSQFTCKLPCV
jgi:hypothetical protein